jgi:hypothetical protein
MKTLIAIAALCLAAQAQATTFAQVHQDGGGIYLTDTACNDKTKGSVAYVRAPSGVTLGGCWVYDTDTDMAIVQYNDGTTYTYPGTAFTKLGGATKKESTPSYYNPNKPAVEM